MEYFIIQALSYASIWWVFVNYLEMGLSYTYPPAKRYVCWKCYTFILTLLFTFNLPLAATASLIAALLDGYLSNQKFKL
jgi:hypothetical protein